MSLPFVSLTSGKPIQLIVLFFSESLNHLVNSQTQKTLLKVTVTLDLSQLARVRFFGKIQIRIFDPRSLGSWCIKGTDESTLGKDSSVPLSFDAP